jgi:hypothetical protein
LQGKLEAVRDLLKEKEKELEFFKSTDNLKAMFPDLSP